MTTEKTPAPIQVAVIGAGLAGLCAAIRLKQSGISSCTVFEKAEEIGGVWRDNSYPGAGCDIPSCLYSYSFERHGAWTRTYAEQPEILDYIRRCAQRNGIRPHIRFGTEITHARFDESTGLWRLRSASGEQYEARVLVTATGQLNRPRLPDLKGMDDFRGTAFHSARWDHGHDLTGRSVAVIGNGCSAVQFVPRIAPVVERLRIFQRSPKWIIPKMDRTYGPATLRAFERLSWARQVPRAAWWLMAETVAYSPIHRGAIARVLAAQARHHLRRQIPNPVLRAQLTPDYPFGCNRMILSNDYYPTLTRPNVELVTDGIERVTPDGIETVDGRVHQSDTIIYATGFRSTDFLSPIEVEGPGGRLRDVWRSGASAYLGMTVPGFPNLFVLYGPNTSSGNNSVIYMLESQVRYLLRCLEVIGDRRTMEVSRQALDDYQRGLDAGLSFTVWLGDCRSWYKTDSGTVTNLWPHRAYRYRLATREPDLTHYRVGERTTVVRG
ncbi:flavin-containing monooxygenase [Streptomyces sp. NPDC057271]|uniref:flavin-containing monooxygenase n=1 Tax=unclassified Streptomyces TaxID=2593676 RepID=UPI003645D4E1